MYVAVIGDLHGLVWEALRLAVRLEEELGEPLGGVLCTGDLGYFPVAANLDPSTRRHAEKDPDELGFLAWFARPAPEVSAWLDGLTRRPPPLYFVRGNHEDHFALAPHMRSQRPVALDAYGLVHLLPDNVPLTLTGADGEALRVIGLGGVEAANPRKYHALRAIDESAAQAMLGRSPSSVDVLVTHDAPAGLSHLCAAARPSRFGSEIVGLVAEHLRPRFHFCGHMHWRLPVASLNGTQTALLNILRRRADDDAPGEQALGLLRWDPSAGRGFGYVESDWYRTWRWRRLKAAVTSGPSVEG